MNWFLYDKGLRHERLNVLNVARTVFKVSNNYTTVTLIEVIKVP